MLILVIGESEISFIFKTHAFECVVMRVAFSVMRDEQSCVWDDVVDKSNIRINKSILG